jgi:hypothetical protein
VRHGRSAHREREQAAEQRRRGSGASRSDKHRGERKRHGSGGVAAWEALGPNHVADDRYLERAVEQGLDRLAGQAARGDQREYEQRDARTASRQRQRSEHDGDQRDRPGIAKPQELRSDAFDPT